MKSFIGIGVAIIGLGLIILTRACLLGCDDAGDECIADSSRCVEGENRVEYCSEGKSANEWIPYMVCSEWGKTFECCEDSEINEAWCEEPAKCVGEVIK